MNKRRSVLSVLLSFTMTLSMIPASSVMVFSESEPPMVTAVSCGGEHTSILMQDGSLLMAGSNADGQFGDGTGEDQNPPAKVMEGVSYVSNGSYHTGIVKSDGSLWMAGLNSEGQLGDNTTEDRFSAVKIMDGIAQVSCGSFHTGILKKDGSLWMTGTNACGRLGDGTGRDRHAPVKIMDGVTQVSCGHFHTGIVKKDGSLWMAGKNDYGSIGDGTTESKYSPVKIMDGVVQVSCGQAHTGIVKKDGTLWMVGNNSSGQLGDGTNEDKLSPIKIMDGVVQVSCVGNQTGIVKKDGSLWMTGSNGCGQLGKGEYGDENSPVKIMSGVANVSCGWNHTGILKQDGSLWMTGYNGEGQLGDGTAEHRFSPVKILGASDIPEAKLYSNVEGTYKSNTLTFNFDETAFSNNPFVYDDGLGRTAIALSLMAYNKSKKPLENLFLKKLDYDAVHTWDEDMGDDTGLYSPYMLAHKKVLLDGKETELVVVVIRGTLDMEWVDDFDSGTGDVHVGFERAKDKILTDIREYLSNAEDFDKNAKMKILVTGHSRGAAVANLLGKDLDKGKLKTNGLSDMDVFVFTFATPNVDTHFDSDKVSYNNIFNIVNPEDFVTKVIPRAWGFGRYGVTYVLPSKTTDTYTSQSSHYVDYPTYKFKLGKTYKSLSGKEYVSYEKGERELANYVSDVKKRVKSINQYYNMDLVTRTPVGIGGFHSLHELYRQALGGNQSNNPVFEANSYVVMYNAVRGVYGLLGIETIAFFFENQVIKKNFECAHMAEMYYAGMNMLTKEQLMQKRKVLCGEANCPVDVTIKDSDGNVVGQIINGEVIENASDEESGVYMNVEGESKQFSFPESGDFKIEISGNGKGTMDYTIREEDADTGEISRVCYLDVPVTRSSKFTQEIEGSAEFSDADLIDNKGNVIEPDAVFENNGMGELSVEVTVEGQGCADSLYNLNPGEYVSLEAIPAENNEFLGWYDSTGNLLSTDVTYGFSVKDNVKLTARFTDKAAESDTDDSSCKNGHLYSGWSTSIAATETAAGQQLRRCFVCGKTEIRDIPALAPTLPAVKISKPKAAKKSATIKWKKPSKKNLKRIKKIEIQYSTDSNFSSGVKSKYVKAKKTSYKIKGLVKGRRYYVRIRAKNGGHVSAWSRVKSVMAK